MKRIFNILLLAATVTTASAVPARRVWQTYQQADGTTIEVQTMGDEFYHYTINRDGQEVRLNDKGIYEVVGEAPSPEKVMIRRAQAQPRRARKEVGTEPYPAPRGLLILVNFADTVFKAEHTAAVMDSLITAKDCQVNGGYGSAAQYFSDQSHGLYQPVFDVYGPVTLSKGQAYYGGNEKVQGGEEQDSLATDAVIEACIIANQQYPELNFADYDWNNDGYVDFVYVIYAGMGEADGGAKNTIWPHNYTIQGIVKYYQWGYSHYQKQDTKLDGVYLDNYAMSQELDGQTRQLVGNGTFCHEFGHVLGLPDFYDINYGTNYTSQLTPNEWDVMDGGAYNGDGHCPPNYSAWEKYFMRWTTPENLGTATADLTLYPNGTEQYNTYQINSAGVLQPSIQNGLNYYIECRQKAGWDKYLPAEGMLIWKVNYSEGEWINNTPNTKANNPRYTLVIPSGTRIGSGYGKKNVWPYANNNFWDGVTGKELTNITRSGKNITLTYIGSTEGIEDVEDGQAAQKILRNGEVVIIRNGVLFDLMGRRL